jgi:pentatricopeptide repeat protein
MHARIAATPTLKSNISLGNALVGMYRRFGSLRAAIHAFDMMPAHDLVSWNALISSYSQHQMLDEAFQSFSAMQCQGVIAPNKTTFSSILSTCASGATLFKGIQMHILAILNGLLSDLLVCNALISMYGKCGNLVKAQEVFDRMPEHNTISWNAIFDAYALNGEAVDIRDLYERMRADRASPDLITFTSILTICSRSGLVDDACDFLKSMHRDYGLMPTCDHFNCVIDLLGRTGKLDEAENILSSMPIPYGAVSVRALMSGCKNKSDLERGERAAKHVIVFDPENTGPYTMLTNLYNVTD